MSPLVSIIIPVYNSEKYLVDCIESALNQDLKNKEIIIIDDGSTDGSLQIAESFKNENVYIFHQENKGASAARNLGLKYAKGDYIQFLDADDFLFRNKLSEQIKILNGSENLLAFCATVGFFSINEIGKDSPIHSWYKTGSNDPFDFLIKLYGSEDVIPGYGHMNMVQPNAWLTPRQIIEKAGNWNENLTVDDDGEFFCRVILASKGLRYSPDTVNYYRKHKNYNNLSARNSVAAFKSIITSIDLKYEHLKNYGNHILLDKIMGNHYWIVGVESYPSSSAVSDYCLRKAKFLGFEKKIIVSGRLGSQLSKYLGWKLTRRLFHIKQKLIRYLK